MKWEYWVYEHCEWLGEDEIQGWLNEQGQFGWELVQVSNSLRTYFFKRPKESDPPAFRTTES